MIINTRRHGRTVKDAKLLLAHLSKQDDQMSRVLRISAPASSANEALSYMQALRDCSRATVAFHHISLSPSQPLNEVQRDKAITRVLAALGADDHAHVVWEHAGKARRGRNVDVHYHVIVGHIGPDGRALDDRQSYIKLEAAARTLEFDFGHDHVASRRTEAVATLLERVGRPDVAVQLRDSLPRELPKSSMSSRQRARAERRGVSLSDVREAVRRAWVTSSSFEELRNMLARGGYALAMGEKPGVWVVTDQNGRPLGALDRLIGEKRRIVAARMHREYHYERFASVSGNSECLASDILPSQRSQESGRGIDAASFTSRSNSEGRLFAARRHNRAAKDHLADPRSDAFLNRLTRSSYRGRPPLIRYSAPHTRLAVAIHRLARIDLDELRRQAEEIGRAIAGLFAHEHRVNMSRDILLARLRVAEARSSRNPPTKQRSEAQVPTPMYRPRA